jgi:hypothetical protein
VSLNKPHINKELLIFVQLRTLYKITRSWLLSYGEFIRIPKVRETSKPLLYVVLGVKLLLLYHWISSISTSLGLENKTTHSLHGLRHPHPSEKQKVTLQNGVTNRRTGINKKYDKL